jgi:hypothetical protein
MVPAGVFPGIFLATAAALILEISLVRLLSVAQWHHFAFLVVSIALLGSGAGGAFLFSFPGLLKDGFAPGLAGACRLFSLSTLAAFALGNQIPFDLARIAWDRWQFVHLFLFCLVFAVPFFFAGLTLSLALTRWNALAGKLYACDLAGGAAGCLLVLGLFGFVGGTGTVLFSVFLSGLAAAVFSGRKPSFFSWAWAAVALLLVFYPPSFLEPAMSPYKPLSAALLHPGARLLETRWNPFSRVDVLESPAARTAPGLSLQFADPLPPQLGLCVDGERMNALTRVPNGVRGREELRFLSALPGSFPYHAASPKRVLVIDPMGGVDVLTSLYYGIPETVVLETNPLIVDLIRGSYAPYSGNLYRRQDVRVEIGDARSFLQTGALPFDLIVLPLTETAGASASGLSGLREDYRLTVEAFQDYLDALSPEGVLSVQLFLLPPPRGELRLVSLVKETFRRAGVAASDHFMGFRSWGTFSLFIKKGVILPAEIEALKRFCEKWRFDLVYYPGMPPEEANRHNRFPAPIYYTAVQNLLGENGIFPAAYPFDLGPPTDDKPFFHHFFRFARWEEILRLAGGKWQILVEGGLLIPLVFLQASLLSFLLILLPAGLRKKNLRLFKGGGGRRIFFFFIIGLAFMFVEISLIQKFILFLGHPVYAVSAVVLALLLFAGLGSRVSASLPPLPGLRRGLPAVAGLLLAYAFLLPAALSFLQGWPLGWRYFFSGLLVAPLGLAMGVPFPAGLRLLGRENPVFVPWAWCANGCASVLGAILPVLIALSWGFQAVWFISSILYLLAWILIWKARLPLIRPEEEREGTVGKEI